MSVLEKHSTFATELSTNKEKKISTNKERKEDMNYVTLNNGVKMPQMGYGVYQVEPKGIDAMITKYS